MGGKGGGGGDGGASSSRAQWATDTAQDYYNRNPTGVTGPQDPQPSFKSTFESNRANYRNPTTGAYDQDLWWTNKGGAGFDWSKNLFDLYYPTNPNTPAPATATAPAPAAPAPAVAAPTVAAPTDTTPVPTAPAPTPTSTGAQLGGAITNPPGYWVGDMNNYVNARKNASGTGGTTGSIATTQT